MWEREIKFLNRVVEFNAKEIVNNIFSLCRKKFSYHSASSGDYFLILTVTTFYKQKYLIDTSITFARDIFFKIYIRKILVWIEYKNSRQWHPCIYIFLEHVTSEILLWKFKRNKKTNLVNDI